MFVSSTIFMRQLENFNKRKVGLVLIKKWKFSFLVHLRRKILLYFKHVFEFYIYTKEQSIYDAMKFKRSIKKKKNFFLTFQKPATLFYVILLTWYLQQKYKSCKCFRHMYRTKVQKIMIRSIHTLKTGIYLASHTSVKVTK